ncbi:hypothetical protein NFI96_008859 [Prochilodus magdalenae]|nr:hypothetical protein NFI96_008859 [Prochilodus magdalenae]
MVVCRELGFGNVIDLTFRRDFNPRDEEEPLISIKCEGNVSAISQCRQQLTYDYLGFTMFITCQGALFGEGELPYGNKEFQCRGTENRLGTCSTSSRGSTCIRGSAVGTPPTCCSEPGGRETGGWEQSTELERMEMFHSGHWRSVSEEEWSMGGRPSSCAGQLGLWLCGSDYSNQACKGSAGPWETILITV